MPRSGGRQGWWWYGLRKRRTAEQIQNSNDLAPRFTAPDRERQDAENREDPASETLKQVRNRQEGIFGPRCGPRWLHHDRGFPQEFRRQQGPIVRRPKKANLVKRPLQPRQDFIRGLLGLGREQHPHVRGLLFQARQHQKPSIRNKHEKNIGAKCLPGQSARRADFDKPKGASDLKNPDPMEVYQKGIFRYE